MAEANSGTGLLPAAGGRKTSAMHHAQGLLTAHGELLHITRKMAFVEGRIVNHQARLYARGTDTFKYASPSAPPISQGASNAIKSG